jgi:hypothetical protein
MYTLRQSAAMAWGKVRRAFLIAFRKKRVLEKLDRRRGACSRCGACCKILFDCPAYDDSDGSPKCLIYNDRPGVCGLFPLDEKDLKDRDIVMPDKPCGFYFADAPSGQPARESMPVRWGPSKDDRGLELLSRKPAWVRGTWAILWTRLAKANGNGHGNGNGNGKA